VLVQLENLRTHPSVAAGLALGRLKLHGWVYKIETGEVFAYRPDIGQFENVANQTEIAASDSGSFRFPRVQITPTLIPHHCA
jgi:carbonic anhydrase